MSDLVPWPRGRCEHWTSDRSMCGKAGRWMVDGEIRCGEHKHSGADVCPSDWKVRGYVRSSHSMFHRAMHECARERGHRSRCRCSCGATHLNPYEGDAR